MPTEPPIEILLVEDDSADADVMKRALEGCSLGVHVTWVIDGEQAMNYLRRKGQFPMAEKPDMILLDLHLPRMTGQEVLDEIKNDSLLRPIPIVIVTSSVDEQDFQSAYDGFANCCVSKPADHQELALTVKKIEAFWNRIARRP